MIEGVRKLGISVKDAVAQDIREVTGTFGGGVYDGFKRIHGGLKERPKKDNETLQEREEREDEIKRYLKDLSVVMFPITYIIYLSMGGDGDIPEMQEFLHSAEPWMGLLWSVELTFIITSLTRKTVKNYYKENKNV